MKHLPLLLGALFIVGCDSVPTHEPAPARAATAISQISGRPIFSVRMTCDAFSGKNAQTDGYFVYIEDTGHYAANPMVTCYEIKSNEVTDQVGGGSAESAEFLMRLRAIGLEPFDFATELRESNIRENKKAEMRGERFTGPTVLDGAEYEIIYSFDGVSFRIQEWNPGYDIDFYAKYSPKVAKLKAVRDLVAEFYGRGKIGI